MPIEFRCGQCGQMLRVPDEAAGKVARCPKCQTLATVPTPAADTQQPQASEPAPPGMSQPTPQTGSATWEGDWPPPPKPAANPFGEQVSSSPLGKTGESLNPYAPPAAGGYAYAGGAPWAGARPGLPWEVKGAGLGVWWETAQLCMGSSSYAFQIMRQYGGLGSPMLFAMLGAMIGAIGQMVWQLPFLALPFFLGPGRAGPEEIAGLVANIVGGVLGAILAATIGLFIAAAINHLFLMMVGGARQGYETTFRVLAFVHGSIAWLNVIPCVGPLIGLVLYFVCAINGLAQAHETSLGKAAAAVLLPIGICLGLLCAWAAVAVALFTQAMQR